MANTSSAKKMVRKIARRTEMNRQRRSIVRGLVRKVEEAIEEGNHSIAQKTLQNAQPKIFRNIRKAGYHKNVAARKISRLARHVHKMSRS